MQCIAYVDLCFHSVKFRSSFSISSRRPIQIAACRVTSTTGIYIASKSLCVHRILHLILCVCSSMFCVFFHNSRNTSQSANGKSYWIWVFHRKTAAFSSYFTIQVFFWPRSTSIFSQPPPSFRRQRNKRTREGLTNMKPCLSNENPTQLTRKKHVAFCSFRQCIYVFISMDILPFIVRK